MAMNNRIFKNSTSGYTCGTGIKTIIDIAKDPSSSVTLTGTHIPNGANLADIISKLQKECDNYYYSGQGKYYISQQSGTVITAHAHANPTGLRFL